MKAKIVMQSLESIASRLFASVKLFVREIALRNCPAPACMPARCVNVNALLMHLCDFDQELYAYVLKWLAYPLRHPGAKMAHALIVNGAEGTGKSLFFDPIMRALYGSEGIGINSSDLAARFNGWAAEARYVAVDGPFAHQAQQALKQFITSPSITVRMRGFQEQRVQNELNFVLTSCSADFLPPSTGHRRFVILECPPPRDRIFYRAVAEEIENGGVDAFRAYLLHGIDLGGFGPTTLPPVAQRTAYQSEAA